MAQYFSFKRLADMTALSLTENRKKVLMQVLVKMKRDLKH